MKSFIANIFELQPRLVTTRHSRRCAAAYYVLMMRAIFKQVNAATRGRSQIKAVISAHTGLVLKRRARHHGSQRNMQIFAIEYGPAVIASFDATRRMLISISSSAPPLDCQCSAGRLAITTYISKTAQHFLANIIASAPAHTPIFRIASAELHARFATITRRHMPSSAASRWYHFTADALAISTIQPAMAGFDDIFDKLRHCQLSRLAYHMPP